MAETTEKPPSTPETPPVEESLFTDQPLTDGAPMLPDGYDGSETPSAAAPLETAAPKKLLRLKLDNGHFVTGENEAELLQALVKGKNEADKAIADRESQIRALRGQQRQIAENVPGTRNVTIPGNTPIPDGTYDDQTYLDLLGKDTIAARRYQDKFIYGGLNPVEALNQAHTIAQDMQQRSVAAGFMQRNPDYVPTPENSQRLLSTVEAAGLQPNLITMEWAFGELKRTGVLSAQAAPEGEVEYQDYTFGAPAPTPTPVPTPQRSRGATTPQAPRGSAPAGQTPDVTRYEDMSLADLRKLAEKTGVLRH